MTEFFQNWAPGEIIALAGVVAGMIVIIVVANVRGTVRRTAIEAETERQRLRLKNDLLDKGRSPDQVAAVLQTPSDDPQAIVAEQLATFEADPSVIEEALRIVARVDPQVRRTVADTLTRMANANDGLEPDHLMAAIRAICESREGSRSESEPQFDLRV